MVYASPDVHVFPTKNLPAFLQLVADHSSLKEIFDVRARNMLCIALT